jgi:hemin uptake protein HemP
LDVETFPHFQKQGISIEPPESVDFQTLSKGKASVLITLNGEVYRLQLTKNQKLILTK